MVIRVPRVKWNSFAVGAATSIVGGPIMHSILVSLAKAGIGAVSVMTDAWNQASVEASNSRAEGTQTRDTARANDDLLSELRAMRSDIAAVKAKVGIA